MNALTLAVLLVLVGCGASTQQKLCDAHALAQAQLEADKRCPLDQPWATCPHAAEVEERFAAALEACE